MAAMQAVVCLAHNACGTPTSKRSVTFLLKRRRVLVTQKPSRSTPLYSLPSSSPSTSNLTSDPSLGSDLCCAFHFHKFHGKLSLPARLCGRGLVNP